MHQTTYKTVLDNISSVNSNTVITQPMYESVEQWRSNATHRDSVLASKVNTGLIYGWRTHIDIICIHRPSRATLESI